MGFMVQKELSSYPIWLWKYLYLNFVQVTKNHLVLRGRKRPTKKFRTLFEWVENEIQQHGEIQVKDVREKASLLVDSSLSKYKKFKKVGDRIKILLKLKSEGEKGKQSKWLPK